MARNERLVEFAEDAMNAGHDFHLEIAAIAATGGRRGCTQQVDGQMARYRAFTNQSQLRRTAALDEHRGILDALITRDAARARELAEAHVLTARDTALTAIGERLP